MKCTIAGDLKSLLSPQFLMVPLWVPTTCCPYIKWRHLTIIMKMYAHTQLMS